MKNEKCLRIVAFCLAAVLGCLLLAACNAVTAPTTGGGTPSGPVTSGTTEDPSATTPGTATTQKPQTTVTQTAPPTTVTQTAPPATSSSSVPTSGTTSGTETTRPPVETPAAFLPYRTMIENAAPTAVSTVASLVCTDPDVTLESQTSVSVSADGVATFTYTYDTLTPIGAGSGNPITTVSGSATLDASELAAETLAAYAEAAVLGWLCFDYAEITYTGPVVGADGLHSVTMAVANADVDNLFGYATDYSSVSMTWVFDMVENRPVSVSLSAVTSVGTVTARAIYTY